MRLKNEKLIAARIKKIMKERKVSQVELAEKIGLNQAAISQMLNGGKGYILKEEIVEKICTVLNLDYNDIISVRSSIEKKPINRKNYEREIIAMTLDKYGVDVSHVIVSASLVFRCDKYTNHMYSCGTESYTKEEMEKRIREDKSIVHESDWDDGAFDEYYEIRYKENMKRLSVNDYHTLIDSLNAMILNSLDFVFAY